MRCPAEARIGRVPGVRARSSPAGPQSSLLQGLERPRQTLTGLPWLDHLVHEAGCRGSLGAEVLVGVVRRRLGERGVAALRCGELPPIDDAHCLACGHDPDLRLWPGEDE